MLSQLAVAKMYVMILFFCIHVCLWLCLWVCVCVCVCPSVCAWTYLRAWQPNQKIILGKYLREWRIVCVSFSHLTACLSELFCAFICIHLYTWLRVCVFSLQETSMKSILFPVMHLQLWLAGNVKLTPPKTDSLLPEECRKVSCNWAKETLSSQCQINLRSSTLHWRVGKGSLQLFCTRGGRVGWQGPPQSKRNEKWQPWDGEQSYLHFEN